MTQLSRKFITEAVFKLKQGMSVIQETSKVFALITKEGKPIEKSPHINMTIIKTCIRLYK